MRIPEAFAKDSALLDAAFAAQEVPPKLLDRNLLVATWNLRALRDFADTWQHPDEVFAPPDDGAPAPGIHHGGLRDRYAICFIASILSRFDVIAITEVKEEATALQAVREHLGDDWGLLLQDVTAGRRGNRERIAFLYDSRKLVASGLVCEIVLPADGRPGDGDAAPPKQFARTPYVAGFRWGPTPITLVALHILFGGMRHEAEREAELRAIAEWLDRSCRRDPWMRNLITLGDFNLHSSTSPYHRAFVSTGLHIPSPLVDAQNTIFGNGTWDSIAWFDGPDFGIPYASAGDFDYLPTLQSARFPALDLEDRQIRRRIADYISDHFPMWVELHAPHRRHSSP